MSMQNFVPEIWSTRLLIALRKSLIFTGLTNRDYEGEVRNAGDTVRITTPSPIAVSTYSGTVTYEAPLSTQQALLIDQKAYWAFKVEDVDALQANQNLVQTYMTEAAYSMADELDQDIAGLYTEAGLSTSLDISSVYTGVRDAMVEANRKLSEQNVPKTGRWMVISPLVHAGFRLEPDFLPATTLGDTMLRTGMVGRLEGFDIYESNNVVVATQHKCLYGTNSAITLAIQQNPSVEALRLENSFTDAVRSLMVWGRRVVRPQALGLLDVTVA